MKRLLIWMPSLELGGAERSLIGLLQSFDFEQVEVDLFLNRHEGELLRFIPNEVHLLGEVEEYTCLAEPVIQTIKKGHPIIAALRCYAKILAKLHNSGSKNAGITGEYMYKYVKNVLPKINQKVKYDLAISFMFPHYFVPVKVRAKKTIAWIHTDYTNIKIDVNSQLKMWGQFDSIVSVSDAVTDSFLSIFPTLRDKIVLIENILPENIVKSQMDEFIPESEMPSTDGCTKLLSIGRFCEAKNFESIPEICRRLLNRGINLKWYIIGYGSSEQLIRDSIAHNHVEDNVIILGKKENPYPFIKQCDVYVQPSRYEGKSVAVREAQMIGKPVIITNFSTASNQLENGVDGVIVPLNSEKCADEIYRYLHSQKELKAFAQCCLSRDYSNSEEVHKIYSLMQ